MVQEREYRHVGNFVAAELDRNGSWGVDAIFVLWKHPEKVVEVVDLYVCLCFHCGIVDCFYNVFKTCFLRGHVFEADFGWVLWGGGCVWEGEGILRVLL